MGRVIAVDFDGVLHDEAPDPGRQMGRPVAGALDTVGRLLDQGHQVIVHTTRADSPRGTRAVEDWLAYFDFPVLEVTAVKPAADVYVDDRALHFETWGQVGDVLGV